MWAERLRRAPRPPVVSTSSCSGFRFRPRNLCVARRVEGTRARVPRTPHPRTHEYGAAGARLGSDALRPPTDQALPPRGPLPSQQIQIDRIALGATPDLYRADRLRRRRRNQLSVDAPQPRTPTPIQVGIAGRPASACRTPGPDPVALP